MNEEINFYKWQYEGTEFERVLCGGVKATDIEIAKQKVMATLKLSKITGVLNIQLEN